MKKRLLYQNRLSQLLCSLLFILFCTSASWGQTVFTETFGTAGVVHPYTGGTSTPSLAYTLTPATGGMSYQVSSGTNPYLQMAFGTSTTSSNRGILSGALSGYDAGYNTVLNANTGAVRWSVNLRHMTTATTVSLSTNTDVGTRYMAVVLCSSNTDFFATGATGYAILLNRGVATNVSALKLVKFTNGLLSTTTLVTSSDFTNASYLCAEVVYNPATQVWSMSYRNDGLLTAFSDPLSGSLTPIGTSTDSSYTGVAMTNFGFVVSTLSTNGNGGFFDNYKVVVDAPVVTPIITKSETALSGFSAFTSSNSANQSFNVSGTNLTDNLVVTTASTDFELSTTSNFASTTLPISLAPSSGTVASTPIYVRLKSGLSAGAKSGAISVSSTGANTLADVTLSGNVLGAYYYDGTGSLSTLSNWGVNPDGSGANPSDLTADNTSYFIKNGSATTDAAWTLGANSKIIVGDVTATAVSLTIANTFTIQGTIDVTAASSGSNSVIVQDATVVNGTGQSLYPTFGTLDPNSEVHYQLAPTVYANGSPTYGKLFIDNNAAGVNIIGNPIVKTSLTVEFGSSLSTTGNTTSYYYFPTGAKATINGFAGTSKTAGLFDFGVATSTTNTGAALQFQDNLTSTLTLGNDSTIGFSKNNTSAQTISTLPAGVNYANLNVAWGTIPNPITVTGVLKVSSSVAVDLATNGNLTLKSTATRTAVVDKLTIGLITCTITGNVIVERFIPAGHRAYRLLSSPTTGGTLNSNWQEGQTSGDTNPGFGTHLTGAGGVTNGFDATTSNASSIYSYSGGAYTALTGTSGTLTAADSYLVFIRGSRQGTNITSTSNDATTLRTTGTLKTGDFTPTGLNATADGFSLIGNPYQAQVDMQAVLGASTNLNTGFYYVVDPSLGTKGAYLTVDVSALDAAHISKYLQPGQACFVKTVASAPASINFTEANKSVAAAQTSIFKTKAVDTANLNITLYDGAANTLDVLKVAFSGSESNDVNQNDALKLTNFDESMATANSGKLLSIEKRANPITTDEIPLNITKYRGTSYTLKVQGMNLSETPYLVDAFTNTTTEVPVDGTLDYAFTVDATNASSSADRFKLVYAKTLSTINNAVAGFVIYPNPSKSNSFNVVVPQSATNASITVSNMLGQTLYSQNGIQAGSKSITVSNVKTAGVYLVSLTLEGKTTTTKWIVE